MQNKPTTDQPPQKHHQEEQLELPFPKHAEEKR
jgi:hypothetical protein